MDVVVTGIGLLSSLGSLQQTWSNLLNGKSGISKHHLFAELPVYPLGLIKNRPSQVNKIAPKLFLAVLQDAELTAPLPECGVVIGSSRGCQANWEQLATTRQKRKLKDDSDYIPDWLETLPHQPAVDCARHLQTTAPVLAPMAACATGIWALARGYELIKTGRCNRVIAGALEAPITPLTLAAFERMGALAKNGCYPFDRDREGLVLGEGGAIFVLETAELATRRQAKIYGKISGFGLTCDAHHISAPLTTDGSAALAIKQALERSNLKPQDIDYIHAHGTSTMLNDRHEAQLIQHVFPQKVAVSSTKGATGHTLGASGAIGTALTLMAFKSGYLPPCVGLKNLEFNLDVVNQARKAKISNAMCFSFGFGGQNTAIALSK